jgi:hypothetical protein
MKWNFEPAKPVVLVEIEQHERGLNMDDPALYRKYAEECERLAKAMSPADQKVMIEIAEAWLMRAKQAERKPNAD